MKTFNESASKAYFKQLSKKHPEAIHKSNLNMEFNAFEDIWNLDNNISAHLSRLHDSGFNVDEQIKVRLTLADIVNKYSPTTSRICINMITRKEIKELTIHGLNLLIAKSRTYNSDNLVVVHKTFIINLAIRYPEYIDLAKYICSIKVRRSQPSVYDAEKGALTDYEYGSFAVNINTKSEELFSNPAFKFERCLDQFLKLRGFVALRLLLTTSRRPIQLAHLKWCDLNFAKNQIMDTLTIRMTKVKQNTSLGFRNLFETYEIPLDIKTSADLITYKEIYNHKLDLLCRENGINLQKSTLDKIFSFMPIFVTKKLFIIDKSKCNFVTNKKDLIQLITNFSQAFHISAGSIVQSITFQIKSLNVSSDRTTNINVNSTRLRHTTGSMLAKMGENINNISNVLGNTPRAAWYYVDLLPTTRQQIDLKLNPLLLDVVNKFKGELITKTSNRKNLISENNYKSIGEAKKQSTCLKCIGDRPIACYGCENFRPLVDADHQRQLMKVQNLIEEKESNSVGEATLIPLKVIEFNIKMTIVACETSQNLIRGDIRD